MPESDDEYIQSLSEDEAGAHQVSRRRGRNKRANASATNAGGGFEVSRTWEDVVEGADGTISGAIEGLLEAGKRKRLLKDTTPLQRGIIRHLIVVLDLSSAMTEKDLRPSRFLLTLRYAEDFVTEYFEQNPISQLAFIGMRDGLATRISDISGNPSEHIATLQSLREKEPIGDASLQNALEMARGALFHAPSHGTREVLVIMGSLLSADPGDIHTTINALVKARIQCSIIGLAAEVAICRTLVSRTNSSVSPAHAYSVAMDEVHYRDLFFAATTPPPTAGQPSADGTASSTIGDDASSASTLLMMGFPSLDTTPADAPSLCACHGRPTRKGYRCARCSARVCALPAACPTCGLTLVLSTHLARSYHHLFPLRNWVEVSWEKVQEQWPTQAACFGCQTPFPPPPSPEELERRRRKEKGREDDEQRAGKEKEGQMVIKEKKKDGGVSESGRYQCEICGMFFCIDCDLFTHEVVHNCPGCLSTAPAEATAVEDTVMDDANDHA